MVKRVCTNKLPTHEEAAQILGQLRIAPEICDGCGIKPCTYSLYLFGSKELIEETYRKREEKQWRGYCDYPAVCETCPEYQTCSHLHPEEHYLGLG